MQSDQEPKKLRTGRPAKPPKSALGRFLLRHLTAQRLTLKDVAGKLHVSQAMISRLVHGQTGRFERLNGDDVCTALKLDDISRRKFFELAARAGIAFTGAVTVAVDVHELPTVVHYRRVELEMTSEALRAWEIALSHDHDPREVYVGAMRIHDHVAGLRQLRPDSKFAEVRLRSATLLAATQEAVETWRDSRPRLTISTYDALDGMLGELSAEQRAEAYVRVVMRRAVLWREDGDADKCAAQLATLNIDDVRAAENPLIEIAYLCQRMHTMARQGLAFEWRWRQEEETIRRRILTMHVTPDLREQLHAILNYTLGVGNKAFMWELTKSHPGARRIGEYASEAYQHLEDLRANALGGAAVRHINLYHPSISASLAEPEYESSVIDTLVWHDPAEALRRIEALRPSAERLYPAILRKLDDDRQLLRRQLKLR